MAETTLKKWQAENSNATTSWPWNQANARLTLARQGQSAYTAQLADLISRTDLDWTTREAAGLELVEHHWNSAKHGQAFETLGLLYGAAPDATSASACFRAASCHWGDSTPLSVCAHSESQSASISLSFSATGMVAISAVVMDLAP